MKKFVIAAAAIAASGFVSTANAADMPAKAPVYKAAVAATTPWTGFYVNGGFGYGLWSADTTTVNPATGACVLCVTQVQGGKGWLGVVGVGYDYQFASQWVAGVFGDFNFGSIKGTIQDQFPVTTGEIKEQTAWAVGGRLGWLVTPDSLVYVNGGYTSARFSGADMIHRLDDATGLSVPAVTVNGWIVGGGTETVLNSILGVQFGPGWFWRNEYRYASYDGKTFLVTGGFGDSITFKPTVQTITSQIVYKFNTGGPHYPAAPVAPANWNGVYINAGVGYGGWAADEGITQPNGAGCYLCGVVDTQGGKGWLGTVGVGFDWQIMPRFIAGAFADFQGSSLKGTIQDPSPFGAGDIKQTSAWAAGVRGGWMATPQVLGYGNIGFTSARFSSANLINTNSGLPTGYSTPATTFNGWFIGGGVEVAIMPNLFWRNEYRISRYQSRTLTEAVAGGGTFQSIDFKPTVQTITTQLVYKFNWWR
jgi:outer membrane immunogenic protein